ncbi:MAG: hypothetical protein HY286_10920, partial [Planctomycetes bacterium]|nr:hypothetical protein [Planctomycetota bacterium]
MTHPRQRELTFPEPETRPDPVPQKPLEAPWTLEWDLGNGKTIILGEFTLESKQNANKAKHSMLQNELIRLL